MTPEQQSEAYREMRRQEQDGKEGAKAVVVIFLASLAILYFGLLFGIPLIMKLIH